jgi:hypothetical protein
MTQPARRIDQWLRTPLASKPLAILAILALLPTTAQCDALDTQALIRRLAKPAPASIAFAEIRFSPLLQQPLVVTGDLGYNGPAVLDRHVTRPYREDTEIRGESVKVRREGEPARSFALKRAPELQGLLTAFTALLAGNQADIEKQFTIAASGDEEIWRLVLTPVDVRVRKRVQQIEIDGRGSAPRCFAIVNSNEGASVMLLGPAAQTELPQPLTREWITRYCGARQ